MRRAGRLGLLIVAIAAAAMVVLWFERAQRVKAREPSRARTESSSETSGDAVGAQGPASDPRRSLEVASADRSPYVAADVVVEPPLEHGIPLLVVDQETGAAKAFALVTWCAGGDAIKTLELYAQATNRGDHVPFHDFLLDRIGRRFRADARGFVRVPHTWRETEVFARAADELGWLRIAGVATPTEDDPPPRRLEVEPRRTMRVEVVDADEQPVSEITLRTRSSNASEFAYGSRTARTDANGVARFENAQLLFDPSDPSAEVTVQFADWDDDERPAHVDVVRADLVGPPRRLVLPPMGRVDFALVDRERRVVAVDTEVPVELLGTSPNDEFDADAAVPNFGFANVTLTQGRGELRFVPLGTWVRVRCRLEQGELDTTARGPTAGGEPAHVDLPLSDVEHLTLHAVDENGQPIECALHFDLTHYWRQQYLDSGGSVSAEPAGRFRIPLASWDLPSLRCSSLKVQVHTLATAPLFGGFDVPAGVEQHSGDVGTIVLHPASPPSPDPPPFVHGVVVDETGAPVEAAHVALYRCSDRDELACDVTEQDGKFEVRVDPPRISCVLAVRWEGDSRPLFSPDVAVDGSQTEFRIVVRYGAGLAAHVLLDPDVPTSVVAMRVVQRGARRADAEGRVVVDLDAHGDATVDGLEPTSASVQFFSRCAGEDEHDLVSVEDVPLVADRVVRDARLQAIDLRGRFAHARLRITGPDGEPVERGLVVGRIRESEAVVVDGDARFTDATRQRFAHGTYDLVTTEPAPEVTVRAHGFRPSRLVVASSDAHVVLRRALEVVVELPKEFVAPAEPCLVGVRLSAAEDDDDPDGCDDLGELRRIEVARPAKFLLAKPGRVHVELVVRRRGAYVEETVARTDDVATIAETSAPQTIQLAVPPSALADAVARCAAR